MSIWIECFEVFSNLFSMVSTRYTYNIGHIHIKQINEQNACFNTYILQSNILSFVAFGCYEFVDPSSAVWLIDCAQQPCHQQSREVVAYDNFGGNLCFVLWEKLQYLDNNIWKQLHFRDEIFTIKPMYQHNRRTLMVKDINTFLKGV